MFLFYVHSKAVPNFCYGIAYELNVQQGFYIIMCGFICPVVMKDWCKSNFSMDTT